MLLTQFTSCYSLVTKKAEALASANQGFHQVAVLFPFSSAHQVLRCLLCLLLHHWQC
jgi:hypothetical protein